MKLKQKSSWITYKEMLNKVKSDSVKSWLTENGPITKRISANEDFELSLIRDEIDKVDEMDKKYLDNEVGDIKVREVILLGNKIPKVYAKSLIPVNTIENGFSKLGSLGTKPLGDILFEKNIFNKISYKYDFLNNLLSFGLHKLWKKKLVNLLEPLNGEDWADLCCGTGDLAFLISQRVIPRGSITGIDSAKDILNIAKRKSELKRNKYIKWEIKDVLEINGYSKKFDGICMSYGLRNLNNVEEGIKKVFYLLKDKGRAGVLDFNHSKKNSLSNIFQKLYLRLIVVNISRFFNLSPEYTYIEKSIRNFPKKNELINIAKEVGFKKAEYRTILRGQMGILILKK